MMKYELLFALSAFFAAAAGGALYFSGCGCESPTESKLNSEINRMRGQISTLVLENDNGTIEISGSASLEDIKIKAEKVAAMTSADPAEKEDYLKKINIVFREEGDKFLVKPEYPPDTPAFVKQRYVNFSVVLPQKMNLTLATTNGSVELHAIEGSVEVKAENGRIDAERIKGLLKVDSENGQVNGKQLESSLDIRTRNGLVSLGIKSLPGNSTIASGNGLVKIWAEAPDFKVIGKTGNGSVNIGEKYTSAKSDRTLSITTENGMILAE